MCDRTFGRMLNSTSRPLIMGFNRRVIPDTASQACHPAIHLHHPAAPSVLELLRVVHLIFCIALSCQGKQETGIVVISLPQSRRTLLRFHASIRLNTTASVLKRPLSGCVYMQIFHRYSSTNAVGPDEPSKPDAPSASFPKSSTNCCSRCIFRSLAPSLLPISRSRFSSQGAQHRLEKSRIWSCTSPSQSLARQRPHQL